MIVRVRAFAQFKDLIGNDLPVELSDGTPVMELLHQLCRNRASAREALFEPSGVLKEYVIIMVNRKRIPHEQAGLYPLHNGDEVAVFPPVAGG
jgi:molybdopterin synthase sulfur carrier subunit